MPRPAMCTRVSAVMSRCDFGLMGAARGGPGGSWARPGEPSMTNPAALATAAQPQPKGCAHSEPGADTESDRDQVGRVAGGHPAQLLPGAGPRQQDPHGDGAALHGEEDAADRAWGYVPGARPRAQV